MYSDLMSVPLVFEAVGWCLKQACACPPSVVGSERGCTVPKMLPGLVELLLVLWDSSMVSEIVPENRSLHNTAVSSRRYFLSR